MTKGLTSNQTDYIYYILTKSNKLQLKAIVNHIEINLLKERKNPYGKEE